MNESKVLNYQRQWNRLNILREVYRNITLPKKQEKSQIRKFNLQLREAKTKAQSVVEMKWQKFEWKQNKIEIEKSIEPKYC